MPFKISAFLLLSCLFGCISKPDIPEGILSISKMSKINADLITAETVAHTLKVPRDSQKVMFLEHYKPSLLKQHSINEMILDSSISFYNEHPILLKEVTDSTELILKLKLDNFTANKKSK